MCSFFVLDGYLCWFPVIHLQSIYCGPISTGYYPQVVLPKSFCKEVLTQLAPLGMARLLLAKHDGQVIAGTITLFYKDTAYFWDAGCDGDYRSQAANDLLHWEIIKGASGGYKYYDLLRVETDRLSGIAR